MGCDHAKKSTRLTLFINTLKQILPTNILQVTSSVYTQIYIEQKNIYYSLLKRLTRTFVVKILMFEHWLNIIPNSCIILAVPHFKKNFQQVQFCWLTELHVKFKNTVFN